MPDGLIVGTEYEIVSDAGLASLADLTIQRPHTEGIIRLGEPTGGRVLKPGGRVRVRISSATKGRIEGDVGPATMDAGSGGATLLLERGRGISTGGGWVDQSPSGHDFTDTLQGTPTVGEAGQMQREAGDGEQHYFRTGAITYAGDSCLVGISARIDAVATGPAILLLAKVSQGRGCQFTVPSGVDTVRFHALTDESAATVFGTFPYDPGVPFVIAAAVKRHASAGYVYVFGSMSAGHEQLAVSTSQAFVVDWTTGSISHFQVGITGSAGRTFTGENYAIEIRDNVSFVDEDDAADQAHAMLGKMRSYHV